MPQASAAWSAPAIPEEHLVDVAALTIPPKPAPVEIVGVDGATVDPLAYAAPAVHGLIEAALAAGDPAADEADANADIARLSPRAALAVAGLASAVLWTAIAAGVWTLVA